MDLQGIFISNLKAIRKEKHITQEKLAELCETDTAYIGQIETRKRFPSLTFVEKIAAALEIEPYLLLKNTSNENLAQNEKIKSLKNDFYQMIDGNLEEFLKKIVAQNV